MSSRTYTLEELGSVLSRLSDSDRDRVLATAMSFAFSMLPRAHKASSLGFFIFIKRSGELLGMDAEEAASLIDDPSWFFCYDDGLTPEQAVAEYKSKNPPKELL